MTNDEKKEYLNLKIAYQSTPFLSELEKRNHYLSMIPKVLYKYRRFDKYSVDMIENDYVFLAPAGSLDDPFDCLTNINLEKVFEGDSQNLSDEMLEYIIDDVFSHSNSCDIDKSDMIRMINESTVDGKLSGDLLKNELDKRLTLNNEQKHLFLNTMINLQPVSSSMLKDENIKNSFLPFVKPKETIGVCSLTTKRDNKPMWSLYADTYKGYCVEYEIPFSTKIISELYPVIYTRENDNNILKMIIKFFIEGIIRNVTDGYVPTDMGCLFQLLCTKDPDWEYQDEWRIIGNVNSKVNSLKIKSIYLGFNVDESNEKKMLELADKKGFSVFKMNKPTGIKQITYSKIK